MKIFKRCPVESCKEKFKISASQERVNHAEEKHGISSFALAFLDQAKMNQELL